MAQYLLCRDRAHFLMHTGVAGGQVEAGAGEHAQGVHCAAEGALPAGAVHPVRALMACSVQPSLHASMLLALAVITPHRAHKRCCPLCSKKLQCSRPFLTHLLLPLQSKGGLVAPSHPLHPAFNTLTATCTLHNSGAGAGLGFPAALHSACPA